MQRQIIFQLNAPGLGDHLFFSCLPRLAKEQGICKQFFVSEFSNFSRNQGLYKSLIWENNPYVDGIVKEPSNITLPPYYQLEQPFKNSNIIDMYLNFFGIKTTTNSIPEIYTKPKLISKLQDKTIYDPNVDCVSKWVVQNLTETQILNYLEKNSIKIDYQLPLKFCGKQLPNIPILDYGDTFENWFNCVYSCKSFFCVFSGSSHLRAAFKKTANVFMSHINEGYNFLGPNNKLSVFKMPTNNYIIL